MNDVLERILDGSGRVVAKLPSYLPEDPENIKNSVRRISVLTEV
jgi:hypothetical protein